MGYCNSTMEKWMEMEIDNEGDELGLIGDKIYAILSEFSEETMQSFVKLWEESGLPELAIKCIDAVVTDQAMFKFYFYMFVGFVIFLKFISALFNLGLFYLPSNNGDLPWTFLRMITFPFLILYCCVFPMDSVEWGYFGTVVLCYYFIVTYGYMLTGIVGIDATEDIDMDE